MLVLLLMPSSSTKSIDPNYNLSRTRCKYISKNIQKQRLLQNQPSSAITEKNKRDSSRISASYLEKVFYQICAAKQKTEEYV